MSGDLYRVLDLSPEQFHQAYPLIQVSGIGFSLDRWLDHANVLHNRGDPEGGVLSVQSDNSYIHALATYELQSLGALGGVIQVYHLCVLDLLGRSAGPLLMEGIEERAQRRSCSEVQVRVPDGHSVSTWIRRRRPGAMLQDLGYAIEGEALSKRLY